MIKFIPVFAVLLVGCACRHTRSISFEQAKHSRPFEAVVENAEMNEVRGSGRIGYLAVEIRLRREDGTLVRIVSDRATLMESAFALDLTNGASYWWPKAINDFEEQVRVERERNLRSLDNPKPKEK